MQRVSRASVVKSVPPTFSSPAGASFTTRLSCGLIHFGGSAASSGYNDTLRIYYSTQRDNVGYNLAYIGSDFTKTLPAPCDDGYMPALFECG